jgi:sucrose-6-phosphate hydrolase SacC (GH32 family)
MVTFTDQTLETTRLNAPGSFYYVLGVTREGGYYYSFYGEGKNVGSSRSTDLILWESGIVWDEETYEKLYSPSSNYPAGTRDPYAYFNPDLNKYHIVATGYRANEHYPWSNTTGYDAYIVLYTSTGPSLAEWEKNPVTGRAGYHRPLLHFGDWVNHPEIGDPECPQIVKIGDYWYILASLAGRGGDHWVGRPSYWIGDPGVDILDVDWQSRIDDEHFLDGEDLCAAQIVEIEGKHYLFGWITQRNVSGGWGGTLNLIREVYPDEDGRLFVRLEPELIAKINAGKIIDLAELPINTTGGFAYEEGNFSVISIASQNGYDHYARLDMPGTFGRTFIELEGNVNASSEALGITISKNQDVEIGIRQRLGQWEIFLKNAGINGKVSATQAIEIDASGDVNIQIVIEGNVAEVFVDGRYALAARAGMSLSDDVGISVFAAGLETSIKTMSVNHLTSRLDYGY